MNIFQDKILLITGGTGSFGNAVLNRFLDSGLKEIRIFSRDEKKQEDMRWKYNNNKIKYYIGDVRSPRSTDYAMDGVDFVFHAAALKQVPSCEFFPMEAVKTNIIGCENVIDSAVRFNVKKVIVLSTDKAVYPINAMGMTKALSEKIMIAKSKNDNTTLCGTRYGNVMGSRGSVIPLFIEQIKQGKDITITNPLMTRFMMSLNQAVDLVVYAYENGDAGDIFVQKSPACTIETLVKSLLTIFNAHNRIKTIGTRHGEKIYETLINREEYVRAIDVNNYFCIKSDTRDLNYSKYFSTGDKSPLLDYTSENTYRLNVKETIDLLMTLDVIKENL